jgi:hypothetical protein
MKVFGFTGFILYFEKAYLHSTNQSSNTINKDKDKEPCRNKLKELDNIDQILSPIDKEIRAKAAIEKYFSKFVFV